MTITLIIDNFRSNLDLIVESGNVTVVTMEAFTGPTSVATAQLTCEMDLTDPYKADCLSYLLRECSLTLKSCTDVSCLRGFPPLSLTFIMPVSTLEM